MRTFRNLYENTSIFPTNLNSGTGFNLHLTFHLRSADCQRTMDGTSTAERGAARSHIPHAPASATEATTGSIEHPGRSAHTLATRSCLKDNGTLALHRRMLLPPPRPCYRARRWNHLPPCPLGIILLIVGGASRSPLVAVPTHRYRWSRFLRGMDDMDLIVLQHSELLCRLLGADGMAAV
jgi:hypothetical protein